MNLKICNKCIMDQSDKDIHFDNEGVCNHCLDAEINMPKYQFSKVDEKRNIEEIKHRIKARQKGEYDCILGLSGGVDSSYLAFLAMEMGLNPLCVHMDNGWDSDIAVQNIRNIIDVTGFDLHSYVINWPEFRDLQRSFFKAGVIDLEILTDHAIFATLFKITREYRISTVLSGVNYATEHGLPISWTWAKMDLKHIKAIQKKFGNMKLKSFPTMSTLFWVLMKRFNLGGIIEEPLNNINFKKNEAMKVLSDKFNWLYYGGKHYESSFTKFYQGYVLPTKFGVDKRKVHFSDLIRNGEISRDDALAELEKPIYDPLELRNDKEFVLKKLGFSEAEFEKIMSYKPIPHEKYPTDQKIMLPVIRFGKLILGTGRR